MDYERFHQDVLVFAEFEFELIFLSCFSPDCRCRHKYAFDVHARHVREQSVYSQSIPLLLMSVISITNCVVQKTTDAGKITKSAHPGRSFVFRIGRPYSCYFKARFSPDDKFSRHRVTIKKRYGVLLTQQPAKPM